MDYFRRVALCVEISHDKYHCKEFESFKEILSYCEGYDFENNPNKNGYDVKFTTVSYCKLIPETLRNSTVNKIINKKMCNGSNSCKLTSKFVDKITPPRHYHPSNHTT